MDLDVRETERKLREDRNDPIAWDEHDRALERSGQMGPRRAEITRLAEALEQHRRDRFWSLVGPEALYQSERITEQGVVVPGANPIFQLGYRPVRPGSLALGILLQDSMVVCATDDRQGRFAGDGCHGTIDYTEGRLVFEELSGHLAIHRTRLAATYEYDLPRIELNITVEPDPAVARTIRAWHERVFRDVGLPAEIVRPGPEDRTNYAQARVELESFNRRMGRGDP